MTNPATKGHKMFDYDVFLQVLTLYGTMLSLHEAKKMLCLTYCMSLLGEQLFRLRFRRMETPLGIRKALI